MHFATLDSNAGLSQNTVFAIAQDLEGFIWIGTEQGLNRYDGYAIEQLHREPDDETGLRDSFIFDLAVDGAGRLWSAIGAGGRDG